MGKITVETCEIEGLKIITPQVHGDARGYFMETFKEKEFFENQKKSYIAYFSF